MSCHCVPEIVSDVLVAGRSQAFGHLTRTWQGGAVTTTWETGVTTPMWVSSCLRGQVRGTPNAGWPRGGGVAGNLRLPQTWRLRACLEFLLRAAGSAGWPLSLPRERGGVDALRRGPSLRASPSSPEGTEFLQRTPASPLSAFPSPKRGAMSGSTPADGGEPRHGAGFSCAHNSSMWQMASPSPIKETMDGPSGAIRRLLEDRELAPCPHPPVSTGSVVQTEPKAEAAVTAHASQVTRTRPRDCGRARYHPAGAQILG